MRIILFSDNFSPKTSASAIQLGDLICEMSLKKETKKITVITPGYDVKLGKVDVILDDKTTIVKVGYPNIKNTHFIMRLLLEILLPLAMIFGLFRSKEVYKKFDLILIYSPSIFLWPLFLFVRRSYFAQRILILRDIFPQWAYHNNVIKNIIIYKLLLWYSYGQYFFANQILIQSNGDKKYFTHFPWCFGIQKKISVLNNWLVNDDIKDPCKNTDLLEFIDKKFTFIYAGNLGLGQNINFLIDISQVIEKITDCRLLIIGRGQGIRAINEKLTTDNLIRTKVFSEIPLPELRSVFNICDVGVVSLSAGHESHNIPGKFVAYLRDNLPVLAFSNAGNDLVHLIKDKNLGIVFDGSYELEILESAILSFSQGEKNHKKCHKQFFEEEYDVKKIASRLFNFVVS